ncbi:uncharacterized protein EV420DRAFT_1769228 [Desarmillaria tabescens]|uniref:Uncharacterized protein n=1 Tax=Armillaria tabescens TaxID=1929756 RepID=A0AA39JD78_ARMTA|nr:uncharacterized protein EV420DRAFT_1769228 [Desarmillaria tabescens]KAK0440468.1 hypothetical protein EV420DRAFT_1769228 [Desarmillaria tabescens]
MSDHKEFLVEALKDLKLTPDEWTAISKACDQCLAPPSNRGLPPMSFVLNSPAFKSNPAAAEALKKILLECQTSDKPIEFPNIDRALKSYYR